MQPTANRATRYVVGFLFRNGGEEVALIRKRRPEWQAGKLNGIGGKVEDGEDEYAAMIREFQEETGAAVPVWGIVASLRTKSASITFYTSHYPAEIHTTTDEEVDWYRVDSIAKREAIPNLNWLIPLALDGERPIASFIDPVS